MTPLLAHNPAGLTASITVGITFSSAVILALLFAFGVFMAVMSQA